jgi:hypothetical protein
MRQFSRNSQSLSTFLWTSPALNFMQKSDRTVEHISKIPVTPVSQIWLSMYRFCKTHDYSTALRKWSSRLLNSIHIGQEA